MKSLTVFVRENYNELVDYIIDQGCTQHGIDYDEIERWVLNDECLYNQAISDGVLDI